MGRAGRCDGGARRVRQPLPVRQARRGAAAFASPSSCCDRSSRTRTTRRASILAKLVSAYPGTPQALQGLQTKIRIDGERRQRELDPVLNVQVPAVLPTLRTLTEQFPTNRSSMTAFNRLAGLYEDIEQVRSRGAGSHRPRHELPQQLARRVVPRWRDLRASPERYGEGPRRLRESAAGIGEVPRRAAEAAAEIARAGIRDQGSGIRDQGSGIGIS